MLKPCKRCAVEYESSRSHPTVCPECKFIESQQLSKNPTRIYARPTDAQRISVGKKNPKRKVERTGRYVTLSRGTLPWWMKS